MNLLFDRVAEKYEKINNLLSFGVNLYWRYQITPFLKGRVLDICTGRGEVLRLSDSYKEAIGLDISRRMLELAKERVRTALFVEGDASSLPFKNDAFDTAIMSFCYRNLKKPRAVLGEVRRVLKRGGHLVILDMTTPLFPVLSFYYNAYLRIFLPLYASLLGMRKVDYKYLAESILNLGDGREIFYSFKESGFKIVRLKRPFFGTTIFLVGERL